MRHAVLPAPDPRTPGRPPVPAAHFFLLTFAWSWAWWAAAALAGGADEGIGRLWFLAGGAGPVLAAALLLRSQPDEAYRRTFLRRVVSVRLIPLRWWFVILAIGTGPKLAATVLGRFAGIEAAPATAHGVAAVGALVFGLVAGVAEEPGWRGVAGDALHQRHTRTTRAILVGVAWAAWHLPLYGVPGTFHHDLGIGTTGFWAVSGALVPLAVLYVWVQGHTGESILAAILLHAAGNTAGEVLPVSETARVLELVVLLLAAWLATRAGAGARRRASSRHAGRDQARGGGVVRWLRGLALVALAAVVLVAGGLGVLYRDQLYRAATHRKGAPTVTTPWVRPGTPPSVHLAVAGDVGDSGSGLAAVATAMSRIDTELPFDGLLLLGDSAYPSGEPAQLQRTVFEPFASTLDGPTELTAILGNHDIKDGNGPAVLAALGMAGRWWSRDLGDVLLVGLDSNRPDDPQQLAWLEETLAQGSERWRIVALHHPPYSAGYHGSDLRARRSFASVFERHGVQLVLSGHEHDYQRSEPIAGTTYVVSGGASGSRGTGEDGFTAVAYGWLHFTEVSVFDDRLVVRAIGRDLDVGDEATIPVGAGSGVGS